MCRSSCSEGGRGVLGGKVVLNIIQVWYNEIAVHVIRGKGR